MNFKDHILVILQYYMKQYEYKIQENQIQIKADIAFKLSLFFFHINSLLDQIALFEGKKNLLNVYFTKHK